MKKQSFKVKAAAVALSLITGCGIASAQIPSSLVTPDKVETRIGTLEFKDGVPTVESAAKVYDLSLIHI